MYIRLCVYTSGTSSFYHFATLVENQNEAVFMFSESHIMCLPSSSDTTKLCILMITQQANHC